MTFAHLLCSTKRLAVMRSSFLFGYAKPVPVNFRKLRERPLERHLGYGMRHRSAEFFGARKTVRH
jgi:hypothetical protein